MPFLIDRFSEQIKSTNKQMRAENYKEAIKICSKILDQQPDHEDALLIISMAALNLGAAYTAEAHLR